MFKLIAIALTVIALAQPAQADDNAAAAAILGIVLGTVIADDHNDSHTHRTHRHRDQRHRDQNWNRRCGWYEEAERVGNRVYYYRYNGCNNRLIGERWEYTQRR